MKVSYLPTVSNGQKNRLKTTFQLHPSNGVPTPPNGTENRLKTTIPTGAVPTYIYYVYMRAAFGAAARIIQTTKSEFIASLVVHQVMKFTTSLFILSTTWWPTKQRVRVVVVRVASFIGLNLLVRSVNHPSLFVTGSTDSDGWSQCPVIDGGGIHVVGGYAFALCDPWFAYFLVFSAIAFRLSTISASAISTAKATIPWMAAGPNIIGCPELNAINTEKAAPISAKTAITLNNIWFSSSCIFVFALVRQKLLKHLPVLLDSPSATFVHPCVTQIVPRTTFQNFPVSRSIIRDIGHFPKVALPVRTFWSAPSNSQGSEATRNVAASTLNSTFMRSLKFGSSNSQVKETGSAIAEFKFKTATIAHALIILNFRLPTNMFCFLCSQWRLT